jgi:hypothetical protein
MLEIEPERLPQKVRLHFVWERTALAVEMQLGAAD